MRIYGILLLLLFQIPIIAQGVDKETEKKMLDIFKDERIFLEDTILDWSVDSKTLTMDREYVFYYQNVIKDSWGTYDIVYQDPTDDMVILIRVVFSDFYGWAAGTDIRDAQKSFDAIEY